MLGCPRDGGHDHTAAPRHSVQGRPCVLAPFLLASPPLSTAHPRRNHRTASAWMGGRRSRHYPRDTGQLVEPLSSQRTGEGTCAAARRRASPDASLATQLAGPAYRRTGPLAPRRHSGSDRRSRPTRPPARPPRTDGHATGTDGALRSHGGVVLMALREQQWSPNCSLSKQGMTALSKDLTAVRTAAEDVLSVNAVFPSLAIVILFLGLCMIVNNSDYCSEPCLLSSYIIQDFMAMCLRLGFASYLEYLQVGLYSRWVAQASTILSCSGGSETSLAMASTRRSETRRSPPPWASWASSWTSPPPSSTYGPAAAARVPPTRPACRATRPRPTRRRRPGGWRRRPGDPRGPARPRRSEGHTAGCSGRRHASVGAGAGLVTHPSPIGRRGGITDSHSRDAPAECRARATTFNTTAAGAGAYVAGQCRTCHCVSRPPRACALSAHFGFCCCALSHSCAAITHRSPR